MNDETFEIRDEDINVQEIMVKIRENIRRRQSEGKLLPDPETLISSSPCEGLNRDANESTQSDLSYINSNWDIHDNSYHIYSHHRYIGKILVKGRQLVHGEVRRYIDPIISRQTEFNACMVRFMNQISPKCMELDLKISHQGEELSRKIKEIEEGIAKYESYLNSIAVTRWSTLYSTEISEKNLIDNIDYHSHFIELIRKYAKLSAQSKVPKLIEIGLGNGTMSIFFSRNELYDVYGIDNDIQVLKYCINNNKKLGGYAKFLLMDAFDMNILNKKQFDVAFSQGTLEHFDNESIIKLISKQLEIAHFVIFSVPSVNWATREIGNERKMTVEEWQTLLREGGFKVLTLEYYKDNLHIIGVITEEDFE